MVWFGKTICLIRLLFYCGVLKRRIPTDDILRRMNIPIASRCWCCDNGMEETLDHLFLTAPLAIKLWTQFVSCAGFQISGSSLIATITQCGSYAKGLRGKKILRAVPALILWDLWKYRNNKRHDKFASCGSMVEGCYKNIQLLIKVTYPQLKKVQCSGQVVLTSYKDRPILQCKTDSWKMPDNEWIKVNTDGTSKENPGLNSYGFCIRNESGNLLYAEAGQLGVFTSIYAEVSTILRALRYCRAQGWGRVMLETDSLSLQKIIGVCIGRFGSVLYIVGSVYQFSIFKYAKPNKKPIK